MSIKPESMQQLQASLNALSLSFVAVIDSTEALTIEPAVTWTLNSDARPTNCHTCTFRATCESYGAPSLRRSSTTTGLSLAS